MSADPFRMVIAVDLPPALLAALNRLAAAVEANSAVLGHLIEHRGAVTQIPDAEPPAGGDLPACASHVAPSAPAGGSGQPSPPAKRKRNMTPEGIEALRAGAAKMRERLAAKRAAANAPPPLPPAPITPPPPIASPPSPPLIQPSPAPRVAVPISGASIDATFGTIRQRAGIWGIPFDRASDLPAVNAKARRLGLPAFNLVKG